MRAPFQILVIPFRQTAAGLEFAVLKRSDAGYWQFVAGGGEDNESPRQAAERETKEETGIEAKGRLLHLESVGTVGAALVAAPVSPRGRHLGSHKGCPYKAPRSGRPKRSGADCSAAAESRGEGADGIPEYCFAIDAGDSALTLSGEHTEVRWVSYEDARALLKWDSNRNALWELSERLRTSTKTD